MQLALVDEAIKLDRRMKEDKKRLDEIKATLTSEAFEQMENKNIKFMQVFGQEGSCNVTYKEKFEIDHYTRLVEALGEIAEGKVKKKVETKYEADNLFKAALIALYNGEYDNSITIEDVLIGLGIDPKKIKVVMKKLKGNYITDKKALESVGVTGEIEEELDAIRQYKNYELIQRFFSDLTHEQIEKIRKSIFVEENISIGLDYAK